MAAKFTEYHRSTFFVSNVHCSSCVAYINQVLSKVPEVSKSGIDVSIFTHEVHVVHSRRTDPLYLAKILTNAAFEVHHVTTRTPTGAIVSDHDTDTRSPRDSILLATGQSLVAGRREKQKHLANCDVCRKEEVERKVEAVDEKSQHLLSAQGPVPESETVLTIDEKPEQSDKFHAQISIGGMSCASCSNSIENEISQLEFVDEITVTLLSNSATVTFQGPRSNAEEIVEYIEDMGFEASLDEVTPVVIERPSTEGTSYIAEIAIGGMTCGSCSGTVNEALNELPFVTNAVVNLMTHNAQVELDDQEHGHLVVEKIEDLGFDASLVSILPKTVEKDSIVEKRTVSFRIEGMFCHHCPDRVLNSLREIPDLELGDAFSDRNPILKVTYTPNPSSITVRTIREKIESAHDAFKATVYRPPSVEDRSREMQHHERRRLLSRFLFVLAVAIPEFIIGIVFMSLVPSDNQIRRYLEQSMWSGSVTRIEWALFIMTTPVMFYGTDVFHVRAAKEIITLWRPGSRVPLLRRFFRFGSMNLLISAGTLVAYVSSVAVLIMDAAAKETHSDMHSTTYFDTVVFLTLFILAGRYMEAYSKGKAGDAVASLGNLRPSEALLVLNNNGSDAAETQRVNVDLLDVGDTVRVPHGASPPADGKITGTGTYQFDESSLTGESKPVNKILGDQIYTGSVNVGQPVEIEITAIGGSSMLDQIIAVVREGQSKRAPLERVADVLVSHFVPAITLIAVLTFVVWVSLGVSGTLPQDYLDVNRGGWTFWSLEFAIAVFVVACPCGLALAAPTALFVGGGLAARYGILVKGGGEAFQEASRLNAIVFDKTGTLTEGGGLQVSDHEVLVTDDDQLQVAWAVARKLEESSNHPIAQAIADFCKSKSAASLVSSDIEEKPGMGMQGTFTISIPGSTGSMDKTRRFEAAIGNQRLYQSLSSPDQDHYYLSTTLSKYQSTGRSTAIFCLRELRSNSSDPEKSHPDTHFVPAIIFAISDKIRPDASTVISQLQSRRIDVFMCTGDNEVTAHAVADQLGIPRSNVLANTLPAGKADFIHQVQSGQHVPRLLQPNQPGHMNSRAIVAFVGDGVNDSPALTASDVSIAMASGSDVAINSASFILLNSELSTILNLALLSRRVINRIKMNFCWALVYNACLIPVAAGVFYPIVSGHKTMQKMVGEGGNGNQMVRVSVDEHWRLSPVWAALAMALSSVSVVCSSLLLAVEWRGFVRGWGKIKGKVGLKG
ncbi:hypothetical protein BDV06DRAFT_31155 [Aspergillus oleicola]